nr:hypothetical protein [Micromonospora sp. DSM 115978]
LADVERRQVDRLVLLGDYLESRVSKRNHDPSVRRELADVVHHDPALWREFCAHDLVLGNQEERVRELLRPDQVDGDLARLLNAPSSRTLGNATLVHGHRLDWHCVDPTTDPTTWHPDLSAHVGDPPLLVIGHSHRLMLIDVAADGSLAGHRPRDVELDRPVPVAAHDRLFVNLGAARESPSPWLYLDCADGCVQTLTFVEAR